MAGCERTEYITKWNFVSFEWERVDGNKGRERDEEMKIKFKPISGKPSCPPFPVVVGIEFIPLSGFDKLNYVLFTAASELLDIPIRR